MASELLNTCARCGYVPRFPQHSRRIIRPDGNRQIICEDEQECAMRVAATQGTDLWEAYAKVKGYRK